MEQDVQVIKRRFEIIGNTPQLEEAISTAIRVASTDLSILIMGESGVGKEVFPKFIHASSRRAGGPYIAVNCGAIPEGTIDSELFGHKKGSFTGAVSDRKGYFEVADGGTIFLDEVGELPLPTQARLLRVLESGEYIPVGESKARKTDVRVVAATNVNLMQAVAQGKFREDLFYRLNTVPIFLPPLRERGNDIYLIFRKFMADFTRKYSRPEVTLSDDAKAVLLSYPFPGNVRELRNLTERIAVLESGNVLTAERLRHYLPSASPATPGHALPTTVATPAQSMDTDRLIGLLSPLMERMNQLASRVERLETLMGMVAHKQPSALPSAIKTYDDEDPYDLDYHGHSLPIDYDISPVAPPHHSPFDAEIVEPSENLSIHDATIENIRKALEKHHGKRRAAAEELGISERTLYRKIKEFNLDN